MYLFLRQQQVRHGHASCRGDLIQALDLLQRLDRGTGVVEQAPASDTLCKHVLHSSQLKNGLDRASSNDSGTVRGWDQHAASSIELGLNLVGNSVRTNQGNLRERKQA